MAVSPILANVAEAGARRMPRLSQLLVPAAGVGVALVLFAQVALRPLDFFVIIFLLLGIGSAAMTPFAFRLKGWAWRGTTAILSTAIVFALLSLVPSIVGGKPYDGDRIAIVLVAIAAAVVLSFFKVDFGVGSMYRIYAREKVVPSTFHIDSKNDDGLHCPRCGSTDLHIASDGSAYCNNCRHGFQQLRR